MFRIELILITFDSEREVVMKTDISNYAIRACINQQNEHERWHSVMFHLRKLLSAETNYDIHNKELLAIIDIFKV